MNKFFALLLFVILVTSAIFMYWYFQLTNEFGIKSAARFFQLQTQVQNFKKGDLCKNISDKTVCVDGFLKDNNGFQYGTDLMAYLSLASIVCGSNSNNECAEEQIVHIYEKIELKKMWFNRFQKNSDYSKVLKQEYNYLDGNIRVFREKLVKRYETESDPEKKQKILKLISRIDEKIKTLATS